MLRDRREGGQHGEGLEADAACGFGEGFGVAAGEVVGGGDGGAVLKEQHVEQAAFGGEGELDDFVEVHVGG